MKFYSRASAYFTRWFHKRNIIIVSERKVKHVPVSVHLQVAAVLAGIGALSWASYSTGSYLSARSALKAQGQALRTVTNAHIENSFGAAYQPGHAKPAEPAIAVEGAGAALSSLDNVELVARIAQLENKVTELKTTNQVIVQRVQDKTSGKLEDLENIVKQTGLNPQALKKQYSDSAQKIRRHVAPSEGGPYIEPRLSFTPEAKEMFDTLDRLAALNYIVGSLPLASPIKGGEMQSHFGHRIDPFNGHLAFHSGLDLAGPAGSKVHSTADGKVVAAGRNNAYGNAVDIDHGFGVTTRYAHLSEILVREGQPVKKGEPVGVQGSTGRSTGAHLHYEVRYHDQAMNPKKFMEAGQHVSQE